MNIEMLLEKQNKLEFILKGAKAPFANIVRRYGIGQVPVFAIDKVTFYENSSCMIDEYIAHRLGQIPILSESGRPKDEVVFNLEASGPGTIYSKSLKSQDAKIKCSLENIPLLKLLEGQNLRLEAKATKGIARMHAKYQAGLISYEILKDNELKFKVESFSQYEPKEYILKTVETIIEKCEELDELLTKAIKQ